MHEFELIKKCFCDWGISAPGLRTGIGDDCLVWQSDLPLMVSTDTAVEGVHFPSGSTGPQVAQRAFLPALSDLAAMAANPAFFTLTLTLPPSLDDDWLSAFAGRLRELADQYGIALAGGDTTKGNTLVVTISVHGTSATPVLRSNAQPDDDVWVTGTLGGAAAALPAVLDPEYRDVNANWLQDYWVPQLPVEFARRAAPLLTSAIDLSDGLIGDAAHVAKASKVGLHLRVESLPLACGLREKGIAGLKYAISGGDDYQLLFTAAKSSRQELIRLADEIGQKISLIGRVESGAGEICWYDGDQPISLPWQSYQHF